MPPSRIATLLRLFQQTPPAGVADNEQVGNALAQLAQNIRPTGARNGLEEFANLPGHALANSIEGAGTLIQPEKIVQGIKGVIQDPQPAIDGIKGFASGVAERPVALLEQMSLSDFAPGLAAGKFLGAASAVAGAVPPGGNKFLKKLGQGSDIRAKVDAGILSEAEAAQILARGGEQASKAGLKQPLSAIVDGIFSGDNKASNLTDKLYRETNIEGALELMPNSPIQTDLPELFFSNTEDIARGQGRNRGVMLEFDAPSELSVRINKSKPAWEVSYENGAAEFVARSARQSQLAPNLRKITVDLSAESDKVSVVQMKRAMQRLRREGWESEKNPDGSISYVRPD